MDCIRLIEVDVGLAPMAEEVPRQMTLVKVHFHGFGDLDSEKGNGIDSAPFDCFSHKWQVRLYPGGRPASKDGMVTIILYHLSTDEVTVYYGVRVRDSEGKIIVASEHAHNTFSTQGSLGLINVIERSVLLEPGNLSNGTLTIDLYMKLDETMNFVPKNPFGRNMLKLFLDEATADVQFEVSGERFHAHRLVLKACAPELASLCEGIFIYRCVHIPNVEPKVFKGLLRYVYGGEVYADWKKDAKKYLDAADKYGIIGLKVKAEALYVNYQAFTVDNVVKDLLYADDKKFPLLREAAMSFITKNVKEVIGSTPFGNVLDAKKIMIMKEITIAGSGVGDKQKSHEMMSVNELRMALNETGEILASRLKK